MAGRKQPQRLTQQTQPQKWCSSQLPNFVGTTTCQPSSAKIKSSQPPRSKLSAPMRFLLLVIMRMSLSVVFQSFAAEVVDFKEIGEISRTVDGPWQPAAMMSWKLLEVGICWACAFDDYDVLHFIFLTHLPRFALLAVFYEVPLFPLVLILAIDILSLVIPVSLLCPRSPIHSPSNASLRTYHIINNFAIRAATSCFATIVYALVYSFSIKTWLPGFLLSHVTTSPTARSEPSFPILVLVLLPIGLSLHDFLFYPSAAAQPSSHTPWDPSTATLKETIARNLWAAKKDRKLLMSRTFVLIVVTLVNGAMQCCGTVKGVRVVGGMGWAALWASAATVAGWCLGWVADV